MNEDINDEWEDLFTLNISIKLAFEESELNEWMNGMTEDIDEYAGRINGELPEYIHGEEAFTVAIHKCMVYFQFSGDDKNLLFEECKSSRKDQSIPVQQMALYAQIGLYVMIGILVACVGWNQYLFKTREGTDPPKYRPIFQFGFALLDFWFVAKCLF